MSTAERKLNIMMERVHVSIIAVTSRCANDLYYQFDWGTESEASVNRRIVMGDMSTEFASQILSDAM